MEKKFCTACQADKEIIRTVKKGAKIEHRLSCGHKFIQLYLKDTVKVYDLLGIKKMGKEPFSKRHKWWFEVLLGERIGRDGKPVFIHQVVDRVRDYYKKFVKAGNKVIKNVEGKLSEHRSESLK